MVSSGCDTLLAGHVSHHCQQSDGSDGYLEGFDSRHCRQDDIYLEQDIPKADPVDQLLMENGTTFHSEVRKEMLDKWNVYCFFKHS